MSNLLSLFAPHLAKQFPSSAAWDNILTLTNTLPPLSGAGVECHLSEATPRTDFILRTGSFDGGREALGGQHPWFEFDIALSAQPGWQPVLDFGRVWANPNSPLYSQVENVWLEFDLPPGTPTPLVPSIFFDLDRPGHQGLPKRMDIVELAVAALAPQISTTTLKQTRDCLGRAPDPARLYYLGIMLSRPTDAIRLCLSGFDRHHIHSYLHNIGWPGNLSAVSWILDTYASNASRLILDLDVSSSVEPTLGLEIFYPESSAWAESLTHLVTDGLCTQAAIYDQLLEWPGADHFPTGDLRQYISTAMQQDIRYLIRRMHHVKLSIDDQGKLKAKAYLYLCYG